MALTREQKVTQLSEIKEKIQGSSSIIFAHYIGLSVTDVNELRSKLRKQNAEMKVGKKTLLQIALKELGMPEPSDEMLVGPVACIFSVSDPVAGPSVAFQFGKAHEQVRLIGGIFDGRLLSSAEAQEFASLPSRTTLLGTFAVMINTPLTQFASMLNSPLTGFARALSEIAKKKEATPASV